MNPVFLIGAERSGTTVLRLMLDAHPQISWLYEFEYAVDMVESADAWPDKDNYYDYLSTHRIFINTGFSIDKTLDYPELIKSFLVQKQKIDNKPIIGATCHRHYDILLRLFPNARFIYLLRDPRDVAQSNIGMGWAGNAWFGVDRWIEAENLWDSIKNRIDRKTYIEIKYEDLIIGSEKVLSELCNFMKVPYNNLMMTYPDHTTYSAPDPKFINQYKKKMTPEEIELVEFKTESFMIRRDYSIHSEYLKKPSIVKRIFLSMQNRFFKLRFRLRYFGFKLFIADIVVRKFRLKYFERKIKMLTNEVDNNTVK